MKLVLQVALGVMLGVGVIAGTIYAYNWNRTRSTATADEREAAANMMEIIALSCPLTRTSQECAIEAMNSCREFHLNEADCVELIHSTTKKVEAELESKRAKKP
jgi:hypothetical protein